MSEVSETIKADGEISVAVPANIYSALAVAQSTFKPIVKNREGQIGNIKFPYATLDVILEATLPSLNSNGLAVNWTIDEGQTTNHIVACWLHYGDQNAVCRLPVYHDKTMADFGKAITYARRYTYQCLIGVIAEEDTDAQDLKGTPSEAKPAASSGNRQAPSNGNQSKKPAPQQAAKKADAPAKSTATEPAQKTTLDKVKEGLADSTDPADLVAKFKACIEKWPTHTDFLGAIYDHITELNRQRAVEGFPYDCVGVQQVWSDDDRKWVNAEITKLAATLDSPAEPAAEEKEEQPAPEEPAEPVDYLARINGTTKSDELFAIVNDMANDEAFTSDKAAFDAAVELVSQSLEANPHGWEQGMVNIIRQHLASRHTAVEMHRTAKESNG